jgi:DNA repair protein RecO (recombination protein O)
VQLSAPAIVCAVRLHGEHGVIARLMTAQAGLLAGYVRGGRSRRVRPVLIPGNIVAAEFRARTEEQLASLTVELAHSRAPLMREPLAAAAIDWATVLTAAALPEGQPYPALYDALDAVLSAVELGVVPRVWASALIRYETLLLAQLGYGEDLAPTHDLPTAIARNGRALRDHLLTGPRAEQMLSVRERLVDRLRRAIA